MSKDIRWISFEEAQQRYGNGGGSFLSANTARVDPSGSDSTGTIGDLGKPFLTVQGAINALEALDPAPNFPFIDIGNNDYSDADVTTSLNTLGFVGRTSCAIAFIPFRLGAPGDDVHNAPFGNLTLTASAGDVNIILKDCYEPSLITGTVPGVLSVQLSNSTLDEIVANSESINVDGGGNSNLGFVQQDSTGAVSIANLASDPVWIHATDSAVVVSNCVIGRVQAAGTLDLYNSVVTDTNAADATTIHPDISPTIIFPDSDPGVAGAGYWVDGVLTKSTG